MRTFNLTEQVSGMQAVLYINLNEYSESHKILGRFRSVPVAILDVALETFKTPLNVIQGIALAVINLVGAVFSDECHLKDALYCAEKALANAVLIPIKFGIAPLKLVFQIFSGMIDPENLQPFHARTNFSNLGPLIVIPKQT